MNIHELLKVFLNESNNKELMLHACMLTGNREDALDLLSDLLIEIYEKPNGSGRIGSHGLFQGHIA